MEYKNDRQEGFGSAFEESFCSDDRPKIPVWVILFLAGALLLAAVAMVRFPKAFADYKAYAQVEARMREGDTANALTALMESVEKHPNSVPMITKLIDLSMETGYYDTAAYIFNEYLSGKEVTDRQYARMMRYTDRLNSYYDTYDQIDALMQSLETDFDIESEEEAEALGKKAREELEALLGDSSYDQAFVSYYLAAFADTGQERYDYLKAAYAIDPELFDLRVQLANAARFLGKFEEAKAYLSDALAKEKADSGALRGMAIVAMLEGDLPLGLSLAESAYNSYPDGTYVRDTYLIALHANEKTEEEAALRLEMEELLGTLEEDTLLFLKGSCTLEEYYLENGKEDAI